MASRGVGTQTALAPPLPSWIADFRRLQACSRRVSHWRGQNNLSPSSWSGDEMEMTGRTVMFPCRRSYSGVVNATTGGGIEPFGSVL
jgi:hypothetical protein